MWVIGLTGGIGSGKSTVAQWLSEQGIAVIDADRTVHELYENDKETIEAIVEEFGRGVMTDTETIDRKALGRLVFSEPSLRIRLEKIIHPRVAKSMHRQQSLIEAMGRETCVWDVPLLFETGFNHWVNEVWVVWVPASIQINRVMNRDALTMKEVEQRIRAQFLLEDKIKQANVLIDNSGSWEETKAQLSKELERIKRGYQL
jgi:dephospho-CoA kinase